MTKMTKKRVKKSDGGAASSTVIPRRAVLPSPNINRAGATKLLTPSIQLPPPRLFPRCASCRPSESTSYAR